MKNIFIFVCFFIFLNELKAQCPGGGELYIGFTNNPYNYNFDLTITTDQYCWNKVVDEIIPISNFSFTKNYITTCQKFAAEPYPI